MSQDGWRKEKMVPADRHGRDEDIAQGVLMLATNRYVNGQTLVIDGGLLIEMVSPAPSVSAEYWLTMRLAAVTTRSMECRFQINLYYA